MRIAKQVVAALTESFEHDDSVGLALSDYSGSSRSVQRFQNDLPAVIRYAAKKKSLRAVSVQNYSSWTVRYAGMMSGRWFRVWQHKDFPWRRVVVVEKRSGERDCILW